MYRRGAASRWFRRANFRLRVSFQRPVPSLLAPSGSRSSLASVARSFLRFSSTPFLFFSCLFIYSISFASPPCYSHGFLPRCVFFVRRRFGSFIGSLVQCPAASIKEAGNGGSPAHLSSARYVVPVFITNVMGARGAPFRFPLLDPLAGGLFREVREGRRAWGERGREAPRFYGPLCAYWSASG